MITFAYADNSQAVAKSFREFQDAIADHQPGLAQIADDFRALIAEQFASEGRAAGTPWAPRHHPLVPSSSRRGATPRMLPSSSRRGGAKRGVVNTVNTPLLVRTGALRDSLAQPVAPGHVEEMDRQTLSMGSLLPYALFHQAGTRRMPARPIIVLRDDRAAKWTDFVRSAMEEKTYLLCAKELA